MISPGPTDTELFSAGKTEEQKQQAAQMAALGRLGAVEDIADGLPFSSATKPVGSPDKIFVLMAA